MKIPKSVYVLLHTRCCYDSLVEVFLSARAVERQRSSMCHAFGTYACRVVRYDEAKDAKGDKR